MKLKTQLEQFIEEYGEPDGVETSRNQVYDEEEITREHTWNFDDGRKLRVRQWAEEYDWDRGRIGVTIFWDLAGKGPHNEDGPASYIWTPDFGFEEVQYCFEGDEVSIEELINRVGPESRAKLAILSDQ